MGTFSVFATLTNPERPELWARTELIVDTGATWMLLPAELVAELAVETPRERTVMMANGDRVTFPMGELLITLNGETLTTIFLAGPPGIRALLGAFTLEGFGLAADPVRQVLVPVVGLLT